MNFYKRRFSCWLMYLVVVFTITLASCSVQNNIITANTATSNEPTFYWRIEVLVQTGDNNIYQILADLGNNPQPVSFNLFNDLYGRSSPGTIVVYVKATDNQMQQLRGSLFEGGAMGIVAYRVNHN